MIQVSFLASPGGVPPAQCHCSQRPEFVSEPSSSAKHVVGSSITSVWIFADIDVVVLAVILPEPRRLRLQRIHDDEELELGERRR